MGILGAILTVERIKGQRCAAPVKEGEARMAGAGVTTKHRQQVGHVLHEGQTGIPVFFVVHRVKTHRQGAKVAVERGNIELRLNRLQSGVQQDCRQVTLAGIQHLDCRGLQIEGHAAPVQLVLFPQITLGGFRVFTHPLRLGILADGILRQVIKALFQHVLGLHHQCQRGHCPFRQ